MLDLLAQVAPMQSASRPASVRYRGQRQVSPRRHACRVAPKAGARVRPAFLPPYSPQLNPIERVWKLLRKLWLHNRYFPTLDDLVAPVDLQFAAWARPNSVLRRLCALT